MNISIHFFLEIKEYNEYQDLNKRISKANINEFKEIESEAPTYKILICLSEKVLKFKKSKIFMEIFHKFERRLNNSDNSLSETIITYNKFFNIIKNNKIIPEVDEEILDIISKAYNSYED